MKFTFQQQSETTNQDDLNPLLFIRSHSCSGLLRQFDSHVKLLDVTKYPFVQMRI